MVCLQKLLHAVQARLQDGDPAPVDAQRWVCVDDGRAGKVVAVDTKQLRYLGLESDKKQEHLNQLPICEIPLSKGSGRSAEVECMPRGQEVVGSNLARCWVLFSSQGHSTRCNATHFSLRLLSFLALSYGIQLSSTISNVVTMLPLMNTFSLFFITFLLIYMKA